MIAIYPDRSFAEKPLIPATPPTEGAAEFDVGLDARAPAEAEIQRAVQSWLLAATARAQANKAAAQVERTLAEGAASVEASGQRIKRPVRSPRRLLGGLEHNERGLRR